MSQDINSREDSDEDKLISRLMMQEEKEGHFTTTTHKRVELLMTRFSVTFVQ